MSAFELSPTFDLPLEIKDTEFLRDSDPKKKKTRKKQVKKIEERRVLPQSIEAEKALISSILLGDYEVVSDCIQKVKKEEFYLPAHQKIFEAIVSLYDEQKPIDNVTLTQFLSDKSLLMQVGGAIALAELLDFVPTAGNYKYYLSIVKEKYLLRKIIIACNESSAHCYEPNFEPNKVLDEVESKILSIREDNGSSELETMKDLVMSSLSNLEKIYSNKGEVMGLSTGFRDFDKMTNGLQEGEVTVIAARPSMGKTSLAINIAESCSIDRNLPVAVFSLEMSSKQLAQRILCSRSRISINEIRDNTISNDGFMKLTQAGSAMTKAPMFIDDTPGLSILELRARARRLSKKAGIKLIVIDYLQLLKSGTRRAQDNRQIEISEISLGIKELAKELSIPIIVLAQLNRQAENRTDGKPRLSDLRESGSIEQDADIVALLLRKEYYETDEDKKAEVEGDASLIIAKNRNGPVGDIPLFFIKQYTRFEDYAKKSYDENF